MSKTKPFDQHTLQYEDWFERNKYAFESEFRAIKAQLPNSNNGIEIGVGSGQFSEPLGIRIGLEPSRKMREIAQKRGIEVIDGVAEILPFADSRFDFAVMITTVCAGYGEGSFVVIRAEK